MSVKDLVQRAGLLQSNSYVCDMCVPWHEEFLPDFADLHAVMARFKDADTNFISLTAAAVENMADAITLIAKRRREILSRPDLYVFVDGVDDIVRARQENKLALGLHLQGTHSIERNLDLVGLYYQLGIRSMLLVYNEKTYVGDGCHEPSNGGLSVFGRLLVEEMNRVGMLIDCSHTGERTSLEAMELSCDPVVFTHSGPKTVFDHPRNLSDQQIKACAGTGGLMGINGVGMFLGADETGIVGKMADGIEYVVDLVGPDHVGLGSDYMYLEGSAYRWFYERQYMYPSGYPEPPWPFVQPEQLPGLTEELLRRGYSDTVVKGFLGENFLRVATAVWR